jgi:fumarylacetoacetate (FAA) hydrolase family protein
MAPTDDWRRSQDTNEDSNHQQGALKQHLLSQNKNPTAASKVWGTLFGPRKGSTEPMSNFVSNSDISDISEYQLGYVTTKMNNSRNINKEQLISRSILASIAVINFNDFYNLNDSFIVSLELAINFDACRA